MENKKRKEKVCVYYGLRDREIDNIEREKQTDKHSDKLN